MLHLVQSNKMEVLEKQLIALLAEKSESQTAFNILQQNTILVQSPGMAQWLKLQIASSLGIAANIEFPLPSSFIWQQYQTYIADLPNTSAFNKSNMAWKLMHILPDTLELPEFIEINHYLQDSNPLKCYQLCHKIADVYDQYQVYRPQWILEWETGSNLLDGSELDAHPWQPILWRKLVEYTQSLNESSLHRANLHTLLIEQINLTTTIQTSKPLYVFGISAMPQQQLEVLDALANSREVFIFWCNPSQHYWGDIVDQRQLAKQSLKSQLKQHNDEKPQDSFMDLGNPLLSSWGKLGRDYQEMLLSLDMQQHDLFVESVPQTLVQWLQHEILNLTMRGANEALSAEELLTNGLEYPKIPIASTDSSLQIHSCHSKVRELEVLHDYLLHQFNQDENLTAGDVIVMMPDVASYAPYIDGVFGDRKTSQFIPFSISDRSVAEESPILSSYVQLINIQQSRLGLTELLALLEVPAIQRRFDISQQEYEYIQFWLADAGVRWGWDAQDKARWQLPAVEQNTLLFGLQRLLAGYAMDGDSLYLCGQHSIAPYADIEGQDAQALGKLYDFSVALRRVLNAALSAEPIKQKVAFALEVIEAFYEVEEEEQIYLNQLREALDDISAHYTQYSLPIDQDIFVSELKQHLQNKGVGQRFLAGYVNFCTLMPMRSIPFKHVCLLGMNDSDYPRQTSPVGFDLMRNTPAKRGDRSRRFDDRYLFLEAILSSRNSVYISYQGISSRDNSPRNPSVLVSELLEYCLACFCVVGDEQLESEQSQQNLLAHLTTEQSLQPFSPDYFNASKRVFSSFKSAWLHVAKRQSYTSVTQPFMPEHALDVVTQDEFKTLDLEDLIRFFVNPAKALFQLRWRVNLTSYEQNINDQEPLSLNSLDRFNLNQRIYSHIQQQGVAEQNALIPLFNKLRAEGELPFGELSDIELEGLVAKVVDIHLKVESVVAGRKAQLSEIEVDLPTTRLNGWVKSCFEDDLVLHRVGNVRGKDKMQLWITWLAMCASNARQKGNAYFIGQDNLYCLKAVPQEQAISLLSDYIEAYCLGLTQPLHFYPETSLSWMNSGDSNKTLNKFIGDSYNKGEGTEIHIARVCPDLSAVWQDFVQLSERLLLPLAECEQRL